MNDNNSPRAAHFCAFICLLLMYIYKRFSAVHVVIVEHEIVVSKFEKVRLWRPTASGNVVYEYDEHYEEVSVTEETTVGINVNGNITTPLTPDDGEDDVQENNVDDISEVVDLGSDCRYHDETLEWVERARNLTKDGPGLVIVGGIGDSGTRGMQQFLSEVGIDLGHYKTPKGIDKTVMFTYDSLVFMNGAKTTTCNGETRVTNPHSIYGPLMGQLHAITYTRKDVKDKDLWNAGLQFVAKITEKMFHQVRKDVKLDNKIYPKLYFGFKHPRTALLLPFFHAALGKQFKFVHVIRDGRDVSKGKNQQMFHGLCADYFNLSSCPNTVDTRLKFWAALNSEISEYAEKYLDEDQYHPIRIEDMIRGNMECMYRLGDFVQIPPEIVRSRITSDYVTQEFFSHRHSYFGRKWSPKTAEILTQAAEQIPSVKRTFERYGYWLDVNNSTPPWHVTSSCLSARRSVVH